MIIVFPMIVSQSVSQNIVPGLAKTLENYLIIHAQDSILAQPEVKKRYNFKIKGGRFIARESVNINEQTMPGEPGNKTKEDLKQKLMQKDIEWKEAESRRKEEESSMKRKYEEEKKEKEEERIRKQTQKASVSVRIQDSKAISVEPTYMTIEEFDANGQKINKLLGVKVIPFRVKSDVRLSRLILNDMKRSTISSLMVALGRSVLRNIYSVLGRWKSYTPTGDPRHDIIMAKTGHKGQAFVVLNKTEDIDENFLQNIKNINRLFKLGWGNIIIVDDIDRIAYFCMRLYKGVCTAISYPMIYQNFGQTMVYNSLEDAKRQSSSLFKIRTPLKRIMAEWIVEYRHNKYICEGK